MTQPTRIGIVGCGSVMQRPYMRLIQPMRAVGTVDVTVACDVREDVRQVVQDKLGIDRFTTDYEEVIDSEEVDVVMVLTSMREHGPITRELDDAARIDGCSVIGLFVRILLPLSKPALGITAIFAFTWSWNEFLGPLIYLSRMETFPLAIAISFLRAAHGVLWSELMVVSFIAMLPPVLLFFVAQKHYIQGIVITGVKG